MSGTSTTPEIILTPEESEEIDAFAEWADENAETLANDPIWTGMTTYEGRIAYLFSLASFDRFKQWLQSILDAARRRLLELKMIDMLMTAIVNLITGGNP